MRVPTQTLTQRNCRAIPAVGAYAMADGSAVGGYSEIRAFDPGREHGAFALPGHNDGTALLVSSEQFEQRWAFEKRDERVDYRGSEPDP